MKTFPFLMILLWLQLWSWRCVNQDIIATCIWFYLLLVQLHTLFLRKLYLVVYKSRSTQGSHQAVLAPETWVGGSVLVSTRTNLAGNDRPEQVFICALSISDGQSVLRRLNKQNLDKKKMVHYSSIVYCIDGLHLTSQ